MRLSIKYTIFALIATITNIAGQELSIQLYSGSFYILISVILGTGIGLVVKYLLDKKYIFQYQTKNIAHDSKTFILYTTMGIVTTFVFWGFEFGFEYLFHDKYMRYLGAVIGLAIGYLVKYSLDKRYVFVEKT